MRHIQVAGNADSQKSLRAFELWFEHVDTGSHVVLIDDTALSSRSDGLMSGCEVLITVHHADGPLTITEQQ